MKERKKKNKTPMNNQVIIKYLKFLKTVEMNIERDFFRQNLFLIILHNFYGTGNRLCLNYL